MGVYLARLNGRYLLGQAVDKSEMVDELDEMVGWWMMRWLVRWWMRWWLI